MTYAFVQDVPIDAEFYSRIKAGLGDEPPKGMVSHVAMKRAEGGLRYIDIWESEESWQRFVDERLHPVVDALLAEVFGNDLPPEPERTTEPLIDVWVGRSTSLTPVTTRDSRFATTVEVDTRANRS